MLVAGCKKFPSLNVLEHTREELRREKCNAWVCLACKEKVQLKVGYVNQPHFAHCKGANCDSFSENESPTHLTLKRLFFEWAKKDKLEIEIEAYLKDLKQRPDLLVNKKICLEIQCSQLSVKRLREREENYQKNGYHSIWIVGPKFKIKDAHSQKLKMFLSYSKSHGYFLFQANVEEKKLYLYTHIQETLSGEILYQSKDFLIGEQPLLELLRLPYQTQKREKKVISAESGSKILQKYHQCNLQRLRIREEKIVKLQQILYEKSTGLQQLPKYFYFPPIQPLFVQDSVVLWKMDLYGRIEKGTTFQQLFDEMNNAPFAVFDLPCVSKEDQIYDFLVDELHSLRQIGCLKVENQKFYLLPHQTKQSIPFDYSWKNIPSFTSFLPRTFLVN